VNDVLQEDSQAVIMAWDEALLYAQDRPSAVWSPQGQTPVLTVTSQRSWVAFYGALNLRTGQEPALMTDKMNQRTSATFLAYLLGLYPDRRLLVITDNASWHKGAPVQAVLEQHPRLEIVFLPPACPELNPQEHVWAAARRRLRRNALALPFAQRATQFLLTLRATWFQPTLFQHYAPPILSVLNG
jgi:transposase